ncbi:cytochrome c [Mucilaginibacter sp. UR6-1]|uniref:c-type cytochrome n=1 Tax=Mucilaginibacter sp. UR6-1 TaxID=1435643 RepID=UPI001E4D56FB|nr:cytochrome c [Mucilaginibacter sp. UR6-1]MCC8408081.1 cytochrome c [Mucilaginibacter sp. UR6-1]
MNKAVIILTGLVAIVMIAASCQNEGQMEYARYYTGGKLLYQQKCQNCHGSKGEGLSALIPPLTDTAYISKNRNKLACIIQNGMGGFISVSGKMYENQMPPSGLSPIEIAEVATYLGNSFGNKTGIISIEQVEKNLNECQ